MKNSRRMMLFLGGFVVLYAALIAPWPGFSSAYGGYFRALGNGVFSREGAQRVLRFEPTNDSASPLDTRILLANAARADATGRVQAKRLRVDSRSVGWIPTALLVALVLATPASGRSRVTSLVLGLFAVHAYIGFSLACYIWNQSTDLGLLDAPPVVKVVLQGLEDTLIVQLGASFVLPGLIWLCVSRPWQSLGIIEGKIPN